MKKITIYSFALFIAGNSFAQLSDQVSEAEFAPLLKDKEIALNWEEIQSFANKSKQRAEDTYAVYNKYYKALENSHFNNNQKLLAIIQKEMDAVKTYTKK